jgi:hypothetical protein
MTGTADQSGRLRAADYGAVLGSESAGGQNASSPTLRRAASLACEKPSDGTGNPAVA